MIAGNGSLRDKINRELERKNLYSKVKLTDWIPQDKLPEQLNDLRFLILPSRMEGLPAIIQQAMACGVVVLATPVGGTPDLVKNEETGFILDNDSPGCIAKTVIKALEHPELIQISQNARRLIEREYNYEVSLRKCEKTLCSTLSRN